MAPVPAFAIRYGDRDVIDQALEFSAGANAPPLEIVLSDRGAVVSGTVTADAPSSGGRPTVYLVRMGANGVSLAAQARASATGAFTLGPVRGGDHVVVALAASAPAVAADQRDRLRRLAELGERVTLSAVDERSVPVRVVQER